MNRVANRKAQRKADRNAARAEKLASEATVLESALSAVKAKRAKVSHEHVEPQPSSSSSVNKIAIQPGKQSIIYLQKAGDAAHQITFTFREPEGSGKLPKDNTSSIPVYTILVDTLATGASMEEYTITIVNSSLEHARNFGSPHRHDSKAGEPNSSARLHYTVLSDTL
jgi:hypothetical protein